MENKPILSDIEIEFLGNLYSRLKEKNISLLKDIDSFENFVTEYLEDNIKWLEKFKTYLK